MAACLLRTSSSLPTSFSLLHPRTPICSLFYPLSTLSSLARSSISSSSPPLLSISFLSHIYKDRSKIILSPPQPCQYILCQPTRLFSSDSSHGDGANKVEIGNPDDTTIQRVTELKTEAFDRAECTGNLKSPAGVKSESDNLSNIVISPGSAAVGSSTIWDKYRKMYSSGSGVEYINRIIALENDVRDPSEFILDNELNGIFPGYSDKNCAKRFTGTVLSYNNRKGYGFLKLDEQSVDVLAGQNNKDIFFHWKDISPEVYRQALLPGRKVLFELCNTAKGPRADKIRTFRANAASFDMARSIEGPFNVYHDEIARSFPTVNPEDIEVMRDNITDARRRNDPPRFNVENLDDIPISTGPPSTMHHIPDFRTLSKPMIDAQVAELKVFCKPWTEPSTEDSITFESFTYIDSGTLSPQEEHPGHKKVTLKAKLRDLPLKNKSACNFLIMIVGEERYCASKGEIKIVSSRLPRREQNKEWLRQTVSKLVKESNRLAEK